MAESGFRIYINRDLIADVIWFTESLQVTAFIILVTPYMI